MNVPSSFRGSTFEKLLRGMFAVLMCLVVLQQATGLGYRFDSEHLLIAVLAGTVAAAVVFLMKKFPERPSSFRRTLISLLVMTALLTVWCIIFAVNCYFITGWDSLSVRLASSELAAQYTAGSVSVVNSFEEYFQLYPNNVGLTAFFTLVRVLLNALHVGAQEAVLAIITMMNIPVSALLTGLIGWKLFRSGRAARGAFLLTALLTGLNAWNTIPYTDPYSLTCVTLTLFLYVYLRGSRLPFALKVLFPSLTGMISMLIKPTCGITLIAIAAVHLFTIRDFQTNRQIWKKVLAALLCLVIAFGAYQGMNALCLRILQTEPDENVAVPPLHFIAMGLNKSTTGTFAPMDIDRMTSLATKEEKIAVCKQLIAERLADFGPAGYLAFLAHKLVGIYYSGMFYWEICTSWYFESIPDPLMGSVTEAMRALFYPTSAAFRPVYLFVQLLWYMMLIGCALCGIRGLRATALTGLSADNRRLLEILQLSILGITLFLLIFECSARHLTGFVGIISLLSMAGLRGFTLDS